MIHALFSIIFFWFKMSVCLVMDGQPIQGVFLPSTLPWDRFWIHCKPDWTVLLYYDTAAMVL